MQALVDYMRIAGLDQRRLAARLGISESQLTRWIRGDRVPTVANLKAISRKTGISLEKLAEGM